MAPVVLVESEAVVLEGLVQFLPPLGPTLFFSQPEKLLMEHSSKLTLASRIMEEIRMGLMEKGLKNELDN